MAKASVYFQIQPNPDEHNMQEIKRKLDEFPGVNSVSVSPEKQQVAVDYDTTGVSAEVLSMQLTDLGWKISAEHMEPHRM